MQETVVAFGDNVKSLQDYFQVLWDVNVAFTKFVNNANTFHVYCETFFSRESFVILQLDG